MLGHKVYPEQKVNKEFKLSDPELKQKGKCEDQKDHPDRQRDKMIWRFPQWVNAIKNVGICSRMGVFKTSVCSFFQPSQLSLGEDAASSWEGSESREQ